MSTKWKSRIVGSAIAVAFANFCFPRHHLTPIENALFFGSYVGVITGFRSYLNARIETLSNKWISPEFKTIYSENNFVMENYYFNRPKMFAETLVRLPVVLIMTAGVLKTAHGLAYGYKLTMEECSKMVKIAAQTAALMIVWNYVLGWRYTNTQAAFRFYNLGKYTIWWLFDARLMNLVSRTQRK